MEFGEEEKASEVHSKEYKALQADLSAALSAFDRAQDWADLAHDLQRVNRVFHKHADSSFLPEKLLLSKRLAQCLNSSLPSGVHLKTLETYHLVFTRIGKERLARDLPLYAIGLFPLYSYAATSLKPALLKLYETHILPLGTALHPVLDGLVLGLLPGLEDETSEFYNRTKVLLENIMRATAAPSLFFNALWRALLLAPPVRLPCAVFVKEQMIDPASRSLRPDAVSDVSLVAYALSSAIADENTLVKRSVLDILVGNLSLNQSWFRDEKNAESSIALITGVLGALLRRDVSLSKRIHAWLLGGNDGPEAVKFWMVYSRGLVRSSIKREIARASPSKKLAVETLTRIVKVINGLMGREEISQCLGTDLSFDLLQFARLVLSSETSTLENEISLAVGDLLTQFGSYSIFSRLESMLTEGKTSDVEGYELLSFALSFLPTDANDVQEQCLPSLLKIAVSTMDDMKNSLPSLKAAIYFTTRALEVWNISKSCSMPEVLLNLAGSFTSFFGSWLESNIRAAPVEVSRHYNEVSPQDEVEAEVRIASFPSAGAEQTEVVRLSCLLLNSFAMKAVTCKLDAPILKELIEKLLKTTAKCVFSADTSLSMYGARAYEEITSKSGQEDSDKLQILSVLIRSWRLLCPSVLGQSSEVAATLLHLQRAFPACWRTIVADGILSGYPERRFRNLSRFALLWRLWNENNLSPVPCEDGLFLMLDALTDDAAGPRMLARAWLANALEQDPSAVLDPPIRMLLSHDDDEQSIRGGLNVYSDVPRALYAFQTLSNIVTAVSPNSNISSFSFDRSFLNILDGFEPSQGSHLIENVVLKYGRPSSGIAACMASCLRMYGSDGDEDQLYRSKLMKFLPPRSYLHVFCYTSFLYLFEVHFRPDAVHANSQSSAIEDFVSNPETDFQEDHMLLAGKRFSELRESVRSLSAEFLSVLMASIAPVQLAKLDVYQMMVSEFLNLLERSVSSGSEVLQLHYLSCLSYSLTPAVHPNRSVLTTVLRGLNHAFGLRRVLHDTLGLRERWMSFSVMVIDCIGCEITELSVSIILTLTELLSLHQNPSHERELLLFGLSAIYSKVVSCGMRDEVLQSSAPRGLLSPAARPIEASISPMSADFSRASSMNLIAENRLGKQPAQAAVTNGNLNLNPLRMLEYVKDVFVGASDTTSDQTDPRRRVLDEALALLPLVFPMLSTTSSSSGNFPQSFLKPLIVHFKADLLAGAVAGGVRLTLLKGISPEDMMRTIGQLVTRALRSDENSDAHRSGAANLAMRKLIEECVKDLIHGERAEESLTAISHLSFDERKNPKLSGSPAAGSTGSAGSNTGPEGLVNEGGHFARYNGKHVAVSALDSLTDYFNESGNLNISAAAWTEMHTMSKDVLSVGSEETVFLALLRCLATFARGSDATTDKRRVKELLSVCTSAIAKICNDLSKHDYRSEDSAADESSRRIAVQGLNALSLCLPMLFDAVGEEEKAGLLGSKDLVLSTASAILKRSADRIATLNRASRDLQSKEHAPTRHAQDAGDVEQSVAAAHLLHMCAKRAWGFKAVHREILGVIDSTSFFCGKKPETLKGIVLIIKEIMHAGATGALLTAIGSGTASSPSGITAVFALRDSEAVLRARALRRIAFCIYAGDCEECTSQLPLILEKLRDALRMADANLTVVSFLCLRILLLRTGAESISAFRATTLSEILRILSNPLKNREETLASLQLLDLITLLNPPEFSYERCFFFGKGAHGDLEIQRIESPLYLPVLTKLSEMNLDNGEEDMSHRIRLASGQTVFGGTLANGPTRSFLVQYARGLLRRSDSPELCDAPPDLASIEEDIAAEFPE